MSSNVPQARAQLQELAAALQSGAVDRHQAAAGIKAAVALLVRKSPIRRAPPSKYMTERLKAEICDFARANPNMDLFDIAARFDVNIGRVSEVLNGKR